MTIVLAVDIGGTKTILQLARKERGSVVCFAESRFESQAASSFEDLLEKFLRQENYREPIQAACIGVAGPVDGESARVTNLPWRLDAKAITDSFNIEKISLINDFQAIGFGIESLQDDDIFVVQPGRPVDGAVRVIMGAGTGLGVGFMVSENGGGYQVYPSEGGHVGFAPGNATEIKLLQFLQTQYAQVSNERILSGPGLENIYWYFDSCENPQAAKNSSAADIARMAADGSNVHAVQAMRLFLSIYGSVAGNLALTFKASGGVYIAGGVAPRIKQRFLEGEFLTAFSQKSKMELLMPEFPVMIIDNPKVGLLGARNVAFHLAR